MPIPKKAFVLDLDDTLMDTSKVKQTLEENFRNLTAEKDASLLWKTFEEVKNGKGYADYQEIAQKIGDVLKIDSKKISTIFYKSSFKQCLKPKAIELIEYLQTLGKVIVFSHGHFEFQYHKLKTSDIEQIIEKDNIFIFKNKKEEIKNIINNFHNQGISAINFIDDRADILDEAYLNDKTIKCFWIRKGENELTLPQTSCVTFQSDDLAEIYQFIYTNNTISDIPNDQENLKVNIGITPSQVRQLITFTNQDKEIQKYTSDLKRFNNKESFTNWLNQGKYIYVLTDARNNLLGIMWFNEKNPPELEYTQNIEDYKITLGIRIYGTARGKGLGTKLFRTALNHFKSTNEYRSINNNGFWSVISETNIASKKLHLILNFKEVTKPNELGKIVMVSN